MDIVEFREWAEHFTMAEEEREKHRLAMERKYKR